MGAPKEAYTRPRKQQKTAAASAAAAAAADGAGIIARLVSADGAPAGPQLDLPCDVTIQQLNTLLNKLLQHEDELPYSFHVDENELTTPLGEHLLAHSVSVERTLQIVYRPQALFHVRALTRCSATLPGHTEAVLAVAFSPDGRQLASASGDTTVSSGGQTKGRSEESAGERMAGEERRQRGLRGRVWSGRGARPPVGRPASAPPTCPNVQCDGARRIGKSFPPLFLRVAVDHVDKCVSRLAMLTRDGLSVHLLCCRCGCGT